MIMASFAGWVAVSLCLCTWPAFTESAQGAGETLNVEMIKRAEHCEVKSRARDVVHYHYCGRLTSGEEFDCSFNYGKPYVFTLGRREVIQGMEDALTGVCVGDVLKVTIPANLAYGDQGSGSKIPPGATLIFWVKVLQIERDGVNVVQSQNMIDHFDLGTKAYAMENWASAKTHLEKATQQVEQQEHVAMDCRSKCRLQQKVEKDGGGSPTQILDERLLHISGCLRQCQSKELRRDFEFMDRMDFRESLESRLTYNFLQLIYYKLGNLRKAATAAFTFFHFNAKHKDGHANDQYYRGRISVSEDEPLVGFPLPHVNIMREALFAYNSGQFAKAIEKFEVVAKAYVSAMDNCFAQCEHNRSIPVARTGQFVYDLALNYRNLLHCQLDCPTRLERIGNIHWENLWAEIYNFLQYSYYKAGKLDEAAPAVSTSLLLNPDNKVSRDSAAFYASQGVEHDKFSVRPEVLSLLKILNTKKELLDLAEAELSDNPQDDEMDVVELDADASRPSSRSTQKHPDANIFSHGLFKPVGPAKAPITKLEDA